MCHTMPRLLAQRVHWCYRIQIVLTPDTPRESFVEQHLRPAEAVRLRQEAVLCSVYDSNYLTGAQTVLGTSKTIEDQAIVVLRRLVRRT